MTRRRALLFLALAPVLALPLAACGRRGPLKRVKTAGKKAEKKDKKRPGDDAKMD